MFCVEKGDIKTSLKPRIALVSLSYRSRAAQILIIVYHEM